MKIDSKKINPIDEEKLAKVIELLNKSFENNSMMRKIFNVKTVKEDYQKVSFSKIGTNQILDREWLAENKGSRTHYAYDILGRDFGRNIAISETHAIIEKILDLKDKKITRKINLFNEEELLKLIGEFQRNSFDTIITNIHDVNLFYRMKEFSPSHNREGNRFMAGRIYNLNIFSFSSVPENMTFIFNSERFAQILEKKKIHLTLFQNLDEKEIVKSLPELKNEDINNKIRILVYEVIGLEIKSKDSVIMLESTETAK